MSNRLDAQVANLVDNAEYASDDEDALIESLEDSPAMDAFREQRIQQLHAEFARAKDQKNQGYGHYTEVKDEKELMDLTTREKYCIVHFAKDDFQRCRQMDAHLEVCCFAFKFVVMLLTVEHRLLRRSTSIPVSSR